jgi:hypothetical protein
MLAAAPPWFHHALQDGMQEALAPMYERLERLTALVEQSVRLSAIVRCVHVSLCHQYNHFSLQSYNMQAASGAVRPLEVVPFRDGSNPTIEPVSCSLSLLLRSELKGIFII